VTDEPRFRIVTQPGALLLYDNERREGVRTWSWSLKNRDEAEALADQMNRREMEGR
jgi:hypothetical protein